jgi:hypothetical protein
MHTFEDKHGKEWVVDLTLDKALAIEHFNFSQALGKEPESFDAEGLPVYGFTKINFLDPDDNFFTENIVNSSVCLSMLWCCVRSQAQQGGIENMLAFAERLDGRTFDAARMAFLQELPCFFPRKATTLRALIEKYTAVEVAADRRMAKMIQESLGTQEIEEILDRTEAETRKEINRLTQLTQPRTN